MRTPPNLSKALSIDESEIEQVLDGYKGLFRKSKKVSKKTGKHFYTLQIRYARQWLEERLEDDEGEKKPPLEAEYLTTLLNFVTHKAAEEKNRSLSLVTSWIAAGASLLVAVLAIVFSHGGSCVG
ncbi:MAG TPA: hypothetical protein VF022_00555 [Rhodanobacteraceae bacterium]